MAGDNLSSTLADNLSALPPGLRATVQAARRTLRLVATAAASSRAAGSS